MKRGLEKNFILAIVALALLTVTVSSFVQVLAPADHLYTNLTKNTLLFTINYTGTYGSERVNCTLRWNSTTHGTNFTLTELKNKTIKSNTSFTKNGKYYWNITCVNETGHKQATNTSYFTFDNKKPNTKLIFPRNGMNTSNSTQLLKWNVTDLLDGVLSCNLTVLGDNNLSLEVTNNTARNGTLTFSATQNKKYTWWVNCTDNATNVNKSATRTFKVDKVPPVVKWLAGNKTRFKEEYAQNLWINTSDSMTNLSSCYLVVDGTTFGKMTLNSTRTGANITLNFSNPTNHTIIANCSDIVGNYNDTVSSILMINDSKTPNLLTLSPDVGTTWVILTIKTDDYTNYTINYGTSEQLGTKTRNSSKVRNRTVTIQSLTANKKYYYNMSVCDRGGQCNLTRSNIWSTSPVAETHHGGGGGGGGGSSVNPALAATTPAITITEITPTVAAPTTTAPTAAASTPSTGSSGAAKQAATVAPTVKKEAPQAAKPATTTVKKSFWQWLKDLFTKIGFAFKIFSQAQ